MLQEINFNEDKLAKVVFVDFRIRSDNLDPKRITHELKIQPSRAWAKEDQYLGRALDNKTKEIIEVWRKRPWGIWAIDSKEVTDSQKVESHILYLLNILESRKEELFYYLNLKEKYSVSFYIWWESETGHGSFEISSSILQKMTNLCHYIEFGYLYREIIEG